MQILENVKITDAAPTVLEEVGIAQEDLVARVADTAQKDFPQVLDDGGLPVHGAPQGRQGVAPHRGDQYAGEARGGGAGASRAPR